MFKKLRIWWKNFQLQRDADALYAQLEEVVSLEIYDLEDFNGRITRVILDGRNRCQSLKVFDFAFWDDGCHLSYKKEREITLHDSHWDIYGRYRKMTRIGRWCEKNGFLTGIASY